MKTATAGPTRPHGGRLVNRVLREDLRERKLTEARELPTLPLDVERVKEVKNIARGVLSPLTGFMDRDDYESVLREGRLASGVAWTMPVVLDVPRDARRTFREGDDVALTDAASGEPVATMRVDDAFEWDRGAHADAVYGTRDETHPGVRRTRRMGDVLVAGAIELLDNRKTTFPDVNLDPWETRVLFRERGWRTVAGYQTRNPPHRAHELVQKTALAFTDGLFINPVIGRKKPGDFRDAVIIDAYQALLANYYPRARAVMSILPYEMQYAGPREAIHHAIMRKNFGCTHFIVGRDHAGVGGFYGPEAAIDKFSEYPDLGIEPLPVRGDHAWCRSCHGLESERTCPHPGDAKIPFSGTRVRALVTEGGDPPPEVMRPDVLAAIRKHEDPFVEGA